MEFDELISNGQLTKAARLFAKEYYDSGRMGNTRRLLIERLADKCDKYDAEIARQSVASEEVQRAIEWIEEILSNSNMWQDGDFGIPVKTSRKLEDIKQTILVALQAYQPWIPCSERMPTEDDADEDGFVLTLDADRQQTDYPYSEIEAWNNRCDVKITHWRPMLPIPKGE